MAASPNRGSITDEYSILGLKSSLSDVAQVFQKGESSLVVVEGKKGVVSGIITIERYLDVIAEGKDPSSSKCRDIMTSNFLMMERDSTPAVIGNKVRGKDVDAVLISNSSGGIHGYFSPSDLRSFGVDLSVRPAPPIALSDLLVDVVNIRDSFSLIPYRGSLATAAAMLHSKQIKAVLIQGKKKGIVGVVREVEFLDACAKGADSDRALARDYSSNNIIRIRDDTPVGEAMSIIEKYDPHAVIILGEKSRFLGYVSPEDIRGINATVSSSTMIEPDTSQFETNEVSTPHDSEILEDLLSDDSEDLRDVLVLNLTDGNNSDVIWNDGGSEIIFRSESISIYHSKAIRMINRNRL